MEQKEEEEEGGERQEGIQLTNIISLPHSLYHSLAQRMSAIYPIIIPTLTQC